MSEETEVEFVSYAEDDLLTPSAAIEEILHFAGTAYQAKLIIADGLHSDKVTAIADVMWMDDGVNVRDEWIPRQREDYTYDENIQLPDGFFRESDNWPNDITLWDWDDGNFVVFLADPTIDMDAPRLYAKGVRLLRKDVLALVGRSNRKGIGGKKPDRERWADFWLSILYNATSDTFDWTQFKNPNQLRKRLLEWSDEEFSESYLDSTIDIIWNQLVRRCADDRKHGLS